MISTTAIIRLIEGENDKLISVQTDNETNNISESIENVLKSQNNAENAFVIGASKIYDGSKIYSNSSCYIGEQLSNESGNFETPYVFYITSEESLKMIWVSFDSTNGRYPNSIEIDEIEYSVDSPYFFTYNLTPSTSHTIRISNWNTPNYPLVISGIGVDYSITINQKNKKGITAETTEKSDLSKPSFGIISSGGTIEFEEKSENIKLWQDNNLLNNKNKVEIYLENSKLKKVKIDEKFISDCDYDSESNTAIVNFNDRLEEWQNIQVEPIYYTPLKDFPQNLKFYYDYLYMATPSKFNMLTFDELDQTTKDILENTMVEIPYLSSTNLWRAWTNVCQISGCYIFMENGRTQFRYRGGK